LTEIADDEYTMDGGSITRERHQDSKPVSSKLEGAIYAVR